MRTPAEHNKKDSLPTLLSCDRVEARSQELGSSPERVIHAAVRRCARAGPRGGSRATGVRRARRGSDGRHVVTRSNPNGDIRAAPGTERLARYFAILREWDQRLTQNESQEIPKFHEP